MSTWNIDPVHSEISFKVKHLMVSTVRGTFGAFEGSLTSADDTFVDGSITFSADIGSVNTQNPQRDGHLKGPDFFDIEKFPKLSFVSTSIKKAGEGELTISGNLTLKGVTKPVELKATTSGINKGMDGKRVAGFELTGKITRSDFGITWNAPLEAGGVVVSDVVAIEALVEAKEA